MTSFTLAQWCAQVGSAGADLLYDAVMDPETGTPREAVDLYRTGRDHLIGQALVGLRDQHGIHNQQALENAGMAILDAFRQRINIRIQSRRSVGNVVALVGGAK